MTSGRRPLARICLALSLFFANVLPTNILRRATAQQNAPQPTSLKVANRNIGGAIELTFDTLLYGDVKVYLPDDMAAGDTISGTVVAEPKGSTPEERTKNQDTLEGLVVEIGDQKVPVSKGQFTWVPSGPTPSTPARYTLKLFDVIPNKEMASTTIPVATSPPNVVRPQVITANDFKLPTLGQQGRAIEVFGPFDGNSSNTTLNGADAKTPVQDFEKGTENVSGGFGIIRPLAESPRKAVFRSPRDATGPFAIGLTEGPVVAVGAFRIVGVTLSAPKTNLKKGERTTVTVEVSGLAGITAPVPLQLDARGVINMNGGNFQNTMIPPTGLQTGGRFVLTRAITGQQAGAFSVTATVIVRPYDFCLMDDRNAQAGVLWNTFTGDYIFAAAAPPPMPRPGGPGQGGPPTLTGTGKPVIKGCIITLTHNAPDRRVFARLDVCTNTGNAEVQTKSPKTDAKITDTNTTDNSCPSGR